METPQHCKLSCGTDTCPALEIPAMLIPALTWIWQEMIGLSVGERPFKSIARVGLELYAVETRLRCTTQWREENG